MRLTGAHCIYIDIVPDVPDTSGESKNNIGAAFGGPIMITTVYIHVLYKVGSGLSDNIPHDWHACVG